MTYQQGFAWWAFEERADSPTSLLAAAAKIGYTGVDFLPPELWSYARDVGLKPLIIDGHQPLEVGFNDRTRHRELSRQVRRALEVASVENIPFLAVASGNTTGECGADGRSACAEGLAPLAAEAQEAGVVLLIEPLNTKVDHPGHECDRTHWAIDVVNTVGSPSLRVLYDFYHAQVMEGDLLQTVAEHLPRIAHFHTAGVPGRHDLDDLQEINWCAIARFLTERSYSGHVTHEFIPRGDVVQALRHAFTVFAPDEIGLPAASKA